MAIQAPSTNPSAGNPRKPDAFGIYTKPTADWEKVLHALDPDLYLVYRAPVTGQYLLEVAACRRRRSCV